MENYFDNLVNDLFQEFIRIVHEYAVDGTIELSMSQMFEHRFSAVVIDNEDEIYLIGEDDGEYIYPDDIPLCALQNVVNCIYRNNK